MFITRRGHGDASSAGSVNHPVGLVFLRFPVCGTPSGRMAKEEEEEEDDVKAGCI